MIVRIDVFIGFIASIFSIVGFLSVKPMTSVVTTSESIVETCRNSNNFQALSQSLLDMVDQVIYVDLHFEGNLTTSKGSSKTNVEPCNIDYRNLGEVFDEKPVFDQLDDTKFLLLEYYGKNSLPVRLHGTIMQGNATPYLVLPKFENEFVQVGTCDNFCFALKGPVLVRVLQQGEGQVYIGLLPIDIFKNSYLTARYECRLNVNQSTVKFFGWVSCLL